MQSLVRDVRYGVRSLLKSPGLSIVAILALTLGIGLTTTMFSIVYGALIKGLPFPNGARIVAVTRTNTATNSQRQQMPIADYADDAARQHTLTNMAVYYSATTNGSATRRA